MEKRHMGASELPTAGRRSPPGLRHTASREEVPHVLGRYSLRRRLGTGGFGTVWLARDERLDRDVAVKILPRERIRGGRFEREARAAARLAHPNIVTLYEAAVDDEGAYLVSELVLGATLDQLLEVGRLSDRDILAAGVALCDALAYAHEQGVVHRDVKPSNILLPERTGPAGQVAKLTDFGIARILGSESLTRTGEVMGTLAYMAPEQAEGLPAGPPADLYALALVVYEALTGVNPIRLTTAAHRSRRLGTQVPPLRRQRRDLPRELGAGLDLALRPRAGERGTIGELREALWAAQGQADHTPGVVAGPAPPRKTVRTERLEEPPLPTAKADRASEAPAEPLRLPSLPARVLAGVCAAGVAAWVAARLLTPAPLAPAALALLAGMLVAALPRLGWLALSASGSGLLVLQGHPGAGLLLLLAALAPVAAAPRHGASWPLSAGAAALGLVGLAGAWPALAGRGRGLWRRAALGAGGWLWLIAASALAGRELYVRRPGFRWSPESTHHLLAPLLDGGVLAAAPVWAAAALLLPLIRRARPRSLALVAALAWAGAVPLLSGGALALASRSQATVPSARALVGAVAAAILVLAPNVTTLWRPPGHLGEPRAPFS